MVDEDSRKSTFDHVVAFIDILGSSQILSADDEERLQEYLRGIKGLYTLVQEDPTIDNLKMFSDNVLIYTESDTSEDVEALISSVAMIQWTVMHDFHMLIRGGVVIDKISHIPEDPNDFIIGKAIVRAHEMESRNAIYPRIVVAPEVLKKYAPDDEGSLIKTDWDCAFVDYLQTTVNEGFPDPEGLSHFRESLMKHVVDNSKIGKCDSDAWDRIRNKDIWTLSYFNDFCKKWEFDELMIRYVEEYDASLGKIVIDIDDTGRGV